MQGIKEIVHDGVLIVKETAPYGKQMGLQAVMQAVVSAYPEHTMNVHVLFSTYHGKPLKRAYQIRQGLYAPTGRARTVWKDCTGRQVSM